MADLNCCTPTGAETECCFSRTLRCLVLILFSLVLYWHVPSYRSHVHHDYTNEKPNQTQGRQCLLPTYCCSSWENPSLVFLSCLSPQHRCPHNQAFWWLSRPRSQCLVCFMGWLLSSVSHWPFSFRITPQPFLPSCLQCHPASLCTTSSRVSCSICCWPFNGSGLHPLSTPCSPLSPSSLLWFGFGLSICFPFLSVVGVSEPVVGLVIWNSESWWDSPQVPESQLSHGFRVALWGPLSCFLKEACFNVSWVGFSVLSGNVSPCVLTISVIICYDVLARAGLRLAPCHDIARTES